MKKLLAILLILCLSLTLFCACDGNDSNNGQTTESNETPTQPQEPEEVLTGEYANDNEAHYNEAWKKS